MHKILPNFYHFIDDLNIDKIIKIHKQIAIIYRNNEVYPNIKQLINFRNYCKNNKRIFLIANNFNFAFRYKLDGFYISAFNKVNINKFIRSRLIVVGSAHSLNEIKIKEKQGVDQIFLSPIFKTSKSNKFLGLFRFNLLSSYTNIPIIALGGVNTHNIKRIKMTNSIGIASIKYIQKYKKISKIIL
tara:strand:- start:103 stop:660 length:558 start_codon:yes stop_codon:yes gene_type:complete